MLNIGDLVISQSHTLKGVIWRVEKIVKETGTVHLIPEFGIFYGIKRKSPQWAACGVIQKIDIMSLANEYAKFHEFILNEAKN